MYNTEFTEVYPYQIIDTIKEGKTVMRLDRVKLDVIKVNALSIEDVYRLIAEANEAEKDAGGQYRSRSRYEFWYADVKEVSKNETVSDDGSSERTV